MRAEAGDDASAWPAAAVRLALGRAATAEEEAACGRLLAESAALHREAGGETAESSPDEARLVDLCRGLLNVNEFLFLD